MLSLIFVILMLGVFGKMIGFGIRMGWGFMKILLSVLFFPAILIGMVIGGLIHIALPILVIIGIVTMIKSVATA